MRLDGVVRGPHHNHCKWGHRGYYRESKCVYGCVYVGGMFQGYVSTTRRTSTCNSYPGSVSALVVNDATLGHQKTSKRMYYCVRTE